MLLSCICNILCHSDSLRTRRLLRGGFQLLSSENILSCRLERRQVRVSVSSVDRWVRGWQFGHEGTSMASWNQASLRLGHQRRQKLQNLRYLQGQSSISRISDLFQMLTLPLKRSTNLANVNRSCDTDSEHFLPINVQIVDRRAKKLIFVVQLAV